MPNVSSAATLKGETRDVFTGFTAFPIKHIWKLVLFFPFCTVFFFGLCVDF